MENSDFLKEHIEQLDQLILNAKSMLEQYPDDYFLTLTIIQAEQHKNNLLNHANTNQRNH